MLVLVTYDVNTETAAGRKRLRKVAKACVDHGQRVQNSVFECLLDAAQYAVFKAQLTTLIDPDADSLRFYQLGNSAFPRRCEGQAHMARPGGSHRQNLCGQRPPAEKSY